MNAVGAVGVSGQRLTLDLSCESASIRDGTYGPTTTIKFKDDAGHVFVWFASGVKTDIFEPGRRYVVKATVRRHAEWKGVIETHLTRVVETKQPNLKIVGR